MNQSRRLNTVEGLLPFVRIFCHIKKTLPNEQSSIINKKIYGQHSFYCVSSLVPVVQVHLHDIQFGALWDKYPH